MRLQGFMAGPEKEDLGKLPDTTGMKHEFIFQRKQRYFYDRCYVVPGGSLVVVGDEEGCTAQEMEQAITPDTAGIGYVDKTRGVRRPFYSLDPRSDGNRAQTHDVPVIVDAAYQAYPIDRMRWISGAPPTSSASAASTSEPQALPGSSADAPIWCTTPLVRDSSLRSRATGPAPSGAR